MVESEDKLIYEIIYYKKNNKLITKLKPLTKNAIKFKNLLIKLINKDNITFLPAIILSLPYYAEPINIYNDKVLGKHLKFKLDIWLSDIDINFLQNITEKYGN